MTIPVTAWLILSLALAGFAYMTLRRYTTLALVPVSLMAALCILVTLGKPAPWEPPAGQYTVLGARIDVDIAIYVLLDSGEGEPVYYKLPYATGTANDLQEALDTAANGGTVKATMNGEGGGMSYDGEPPVTEDSNKQAERPELQVGG